MEEHKEWLNEAREVFPKLDKKVILAEYKKMSAKKLGFVRAKIEKSLDFDAEAFILGNDTRIKTKVKEPNEFNIFINEELRKIKNEALRKEIIQYIIIHELLHIESKDLVTLTKQFSRRKKKKIHTHDFEQEILDRYNLLREKRSIIKIDKVEHLERAISRILESIGWFKQ